MKIKPIISFEGISGSGKTYFINKLKTDEQFLDTVFIKELSERDNNSFENKIINILKSKSNLFFSKGNPYTETLLLLAIKTYDYENLKNNKGLKYKFIFLDRRIFDENEIITKILNFKCSTLI